MTRLYAFYNDTYVSSETDKETVTAGNRAADDFVFPSLDGSFEFQLDGAGEWTHGPVTVTRPADPFDTQLYYTADRTALSVGAGGELEIGDHTLDLIKQRNRWMVDPRDETLYINGRRITGKTTLETGDVVFFSYTTLTFVEEDMVQVGSHKHVKSALTPSKLPFSEMKKQYPDYRRTPRMMYDLPGEKVQFSFPGQEGEDHGRSLWLIILPPLVMLVVMGTVALLIPRGLFIIISVMMFTTTLITSTMQYFREKKKRKEREEKRQRVYTNYMRQKREELQGLKEKQQHVLRYHYPSFEQMKRYTEEISNRIWERTPEHADFLDLRLGTATLPSSYEVSVGSADFANREIDDLIEQSQEIMNVYRHVEDVPLTTGLTRNPVGLVGKKRIVHKQIHQLIGQLAFFHSYQDLRIVLIFDEKDYDDWKWMRWLPHIQLPNSFAKGMIYNEQTRDQLLPSLYSMIRERDMEEDKENVSFRPHFVFVIANPNLISDHVFMEYVEQDTSELDVSFLFAAETREMLSNQVHTLVQYITEHEGEVSIQEGQAVHKAFRLDCHETNTHEAFARTLHSLNHATGISNSIPEKVTFLDLIGHDADDLQIAEYWTTNSSQKSLAAPIGLKGRTDVVELNLHEKAHGPHGLLAGTTGSGKSELLQTYILSLAVHYHPHEVAFLLIDYKGGGMAQPFENVPHLLGTITNIEESANFSSRALASIKSELKRRQTLFERYKVNHINAYTALYKEGEAEEPMPHLFIISDEFAELKNEEPEFIAELVSAARIGRSLGVHLILATQKPGGVIDDQIWSNSRFRIALQVQDANDSKEIIKNSDAADIQTTGRGYLQVGNNEVYELFQSAWSGAPHQQDTYDGEDQVQLVTDLGLIGLTDVETEDEPTYREKKTEIDATVEAIYRTQSEMGIERLPSPWLPPLAERIERTPVEHGEKQVAIGQKDEPDRQLQEPYRYHIGRDGNIGIFGSSGYGKSHTLMTLLLDMAEAESPEARHYYVFDFGNGALLPLKNLPHTADYFRYDDDRKMEKFTTMMKEEIDRRKQLFLEEEVSTISLYNELAQDPLAHITVVVDNFDLVKEERTELENPFIQLARDGQTLGITVILSATRVNAVRQPLLNNLKTKVIHYLIDPTEKYSLVGRTPYELEAIPGRALVHNEATYLTQVYLPARGDDDAEVLDGVKRQVQVLKERYEESVTPDPIPMLPSRLGYDLFVEEYVTGALNSGSIAIGLDEDSVEPVQVDLSEHCLVTGQARNGKTNVLKVMLEQMLDQRYEQIAVFDGIDRGLFSYKQKEGVVGLDTKDRIAEWTADVEAKLKEREGAFLEDMERGGAGNGFRPIYLVIDSLSRFNETTDSVLQGKISGLIKQYSHLGFRVIVSGNLPEFTKGFDTLTGELKQIRQAVLLMKKSDQSLFQLPFERKEPQVQPGYGYHVLNGRERMVQIPLCEEKRDQIGV
ncbi:type VII secretion protein EssC [Halobacillus litoralis]|uniref:type VII secretion protein EssC n=1 Tax=Halobacillus litoralis TaxID=45668 RepID=UPI001CD244A5|nr:type VII secretion protein EssC [Halobacillus litoralis]MCA0970754.1 type VII secretion protein EssC [Halobacillus litoralis]